MYIAFTYGLIYTLFNMAYVVAGGETTGGERYIYSILDWSNVLTPAPHGTETAVIYIVVLLFLGVPLCTLLAWGLQVCRERCIKSRPIPAEKVIMIHQIKSEANILGIKTPRLGQIAVEPGDKAVEMEEQSHHADRQDESSSGSPKTDNESDGVSASA